LETLGSGFFKDGKTEEYHEAKFDHELELMLITKPMMPMALIRAWNGNR
jgi:hypothetical protein